MVPKQAVGGYGIGVRVIIAPYPEWMEHVPYPPSYQIPNFFRPEMTHWLIWCIFNKSVG